MTHQRDGAVQTGRRRPALYLAVGAAAVLLLLMGGWAMWQSPPAPEGDPVDLAKFVATSRYEALPEEDKRPYMKLIRSGMDEIAAAARDGRLTQQEYEAAYLNAKLERRIDDMKDYFSHPAATRQKVLAAEYRKKASSSKPATAGGDEPPQPDDETEDDYFEKRVEQWPPEEQEKWEEFRRARKKAKEAAK